jgi:hypothetical protein
MAIADFYRPDYPDGTQHSAQSVLPKIIEKTLTCSDYFINACLVTPSTNPIGIFGFAEFVQALALLVVVYTFTDTQYKFRVAVAPLPLFPITFHAIWIIGLATILSDYWYALGYEVPYFLKNQGRVQALLAVCFMAIVLLWIWFGFIAPPTYGRFNRLRFAKTLFRYVSQGSPSSLSVVAAEMSRSSGSLIKYSYEIERHGKNVPPNKTAQVANDLLLLIGDPKFCRAIVADSPWTAIAIFEQATKSKKYHLPLGQFAANITSAALTNPDSALHAELDGPNSGLIGYVQRFSKTLYGNFALVEGLARGYPSPLDVRFSYKEGWTGKAWDAYGKIVLLTLKDYVEGGHWGTHSYSLVRALGNLERAGQQLYEIEKSGEGGWRSLPYQRFRSTCDFLNDTLSYLDSRHALPKPVKLRIMEDDEFRKYDLYDYLAKLAFELVLDSTAVNRQDFFTWEVQHNGIWNAVFGFNNGEASKIIQFKLRRQIYDEIKRLETFPNYKSARILGYCLNVLGLANARKRTGYGKEAFALRVAVLEWTRLNYHQLRNKLPDVADAALQGSVSFDQRNHRLVYNHPKNLRRRAKKTYLSLELALVKDHRKKK